MQRMPIERAPQPEAKRQGRAMAVISSTATTPASTSATSSATNSLSSAHTSLSTIPSSSLPRSLVTTTSSVVTSSDAQHLTASAPSRSFVAVTTTSSILPPTSTPQPNATHSGLSVGALVGIVAGSVVVCAALFVLLVRKTYLRRRDRDHIPWSVTPALRVDINDDPKSFSDTSEPRTSPTSVPSTPQKSVPQFPIVVHVQSMHSTPAAPPPLTQHPSIPTYPVPIPPPATYNNPVVAYPTQPDSMAYCPVNPSHLVTPGATDTGIPSTAPSVRAPVETTVKCTFVPSLPDELSITAGERIFVVEQFDDGWDSCVNVRGERGVVPRECLLRVPVDQPDLNWRNVRRTSSLNPDGQK